MTLIKLIEFATSSHRDTHNTFCGGASICLGPNITGKIKWLIHFVTLDFFKCFPRKSFNEPRNINIAYDALSRYAFPPTKFTFRNVTSKHSFICILFEATTIQQHIPRTIPRPKRCKSSCNLFHFFKANSLYHINRNVILNTTWNVIIINK